jgi:cold-inducible RNA-binding protein
MSKKIYVGSLPYSTTAADLQELFGSAGTVDNATVISDRETGRSKGFGFVEMPNDEEADKAIDQFNGYDLDGRSLVVNEARPQEPRTGGSFGGGNRGGGNGGGSSFGGARRRY